MSGTITINSTDLANAIKPQLLQMPEITQQPYSYIIFTDGTNYYAKNGKTGQIDYSGTDASTVIQSAIDAVKSGRIYLKLGTVAFSRKVIININSNSQLTIEGDGATTIIPPSNDYAFEFNANSDWSKRLVMRNLWFKSSTNQYAIHIVDAHRPTFELCYFDRANVLVESINTWSEAYTELQCYHNHAGVEFRKTGGTGSWSDTTLIHSHFDNIGPGEFGIRINGGSMYRALMYIVSHISGGSLFDIKDGDFRQNDVFAVLDGSSGTFFNITTTLNCNNNDIKITLPPPGTTLINNPNKVLVGNIRLIWSNDTVNYFNVLPIGTNNTYGSEVSALEYSWNRLPWIRITVAGTFASGETVTVRINVYYAHKTKYIEKSFTSPTSYELAMNDYIDLLDIYDGINPLQITFQAKTNMASTSVAIYINVLKR